MNEQTTQKDHYTVGVEMLNDLQHQQIRDLQAENERLMALINKITVYVIQHIRHYAEYSVPANDFAQLAAMIASELNKNKLADSAKEK